MAHRRTEWVTRLVVVALFAACGSGEGGGTDSSTHDVESPDGALHDTTADAAGAPDAADAADDDTKVDVADVESMDTSDPPPRTFADVCHRIAAASCAGASECCEPGATEQCEAALQQACLANGVQESEGVLAGTLVIDAAALSACEADASLAASQCGVSANSAADSPCRAIVLDPATAGQPCGSDLGGIRCHGGGGICFPEPGLVTCNAWAQPGEPCAQAPCGPNQFCMPNADGGGTMVCDAARGEGSLCQADVHCQPGLRCVADTCSRQLPIGSSCDNSYDCTSGSYCDPAEEKCAALLAKDAPCYSLLGCEPGLACVGFHVADVCWPGEPADGQDDPELPSNFEECNGVCFTGWTCQPGPAAGACVPAICSLVPSGE